MPVTSDAPGARISETGQILADEGSPPANRLAQRVTFTAMELVD
jgi:hypothetical protein